MKIPNDFMEEALKNVLEEYGLTEDMSLKDCVEKQIPKKPYVKSSDYNFKGYYCPCCYGYVRSVHTRMEIIREEDVYCGRCGQKLDWK